MHMAVTGLPYFSPKPELDAIPLDVEGRSFEILKPGEDPGYPRWWVFQVREGKISRVLHRYFDDQLLKQTAGKVAEEVINLLGNFCPKSWLEENRKQLQERIVAALTG